MPIDRSLLHGLLDRLLDAREETENAFAEGDGRKATRAAFDVYQQTWTLAREAAAPAIEFTLRRAALNLTPDDPEPHPLPVLDEEAWRRGWTLATARLLYDLQIVVGDALPAVQIARDLIEGAEHGEPPIVLWRASKPPGKRTHEDLLKNARRRVVRAVYYKAGQAGMTVDKAKDALDLGVSEQTWKALVKRVPRADRERAKLAGSHGESWDTLPNDLESARFNQLALFALPRAGGS